MGIYGRYEVIVYTTAEEKLNEVEKILSDWGKIDYGDNSISVFAQDDLSFNVEDDIRNLAKQLAKYGRVEYAIWYDERDPDISGEEEAVKEYQFLDKWGEKA